MFSHIEYKKESELILKLKRTWVPALTLPFPFQLPELIQLT